MNEKILGKEIISLLEDAVGESIQNFEVVIRDDSGAGKGYLGDMVSKFYQFIQSIVRLSLSIFISFNFWGFALNFSR